MKIPSSNIAININTTELAGVVALSHSLKHDSVVGKSSHHETVDSSEPVLPLSFLYEDISPKLGVWNLNPMSSSRQARCISDFKRKLSENVPIVAGYWLQSFISCLFIAYSRELWKSAQRIFLLKGKEGRRNQNN